MNSRSSFDPYKFISATDHDGSAFHASIYSHFFTYNSKFLHTKERIHELVMAEVLFPNIFNILSTRSRRRIRYLNDGDVVTIRNAHGTYITACEDRRTVLLKEKMEGTNNGQHWTVELQRRLLGNLSNRFYLKSVYGTYLNVRALSTTWLGYPKETIVCQVPAPPCRPEEDKYYTNWWELIRSPSSQAASDWFGLATMFYYDDPYFTILVPHHEDRLLMAVQESSNCEYWNFQVVGNDKEERKPPVSVPVAVPPSEKCKVEINLNSLMGSSAGPSGTVGGVAPPSLYNSGQNTNGSGTQNNGDVDIRNKVGKYENFNFMFQL